MTRLFTTSLFSLILFGCLFIPAVGESAICSSPPEDLSKPADLLKAIVTSLQYLRDSRDVIQEMDVQSSASDAILAFKNADNLMECAASQISPLKASKTENVSELAGLMDTSIIILRQHGDYTLNKLKMVLDGKKEMGSPSEIAEKDAEKKLGVKTAWESYALAVAYSTHAAMDTKRQGYLLLTKAEKNELLAQIDKSFKKMKKGTNHAIESSADLLRTFLNKKWKFADQKK